MYIYTSIKNKIVENLVKLNFSCTVYYITEYVQFLGVCSEFTIKGGNTNFVNF